MSAMNRRDGHRVRCDSSADIKVLSMPGHTKCPKIRLHCTTTDLSYQGVRVSILADHLTQGLTSAETALPIGTKVKMVVQFTTPRKKFVHLATLRWIRKRPGSAVLLMGYEFEDTPEKVLKAWTLFLEAYIASREELERAEETNPPAHVNIFLQR